MRTYSFFLNDTWRLNNNFSFNIGLRYDKNDASDSTGATTADDSAFSPPLGVTYDVFADGRLRFNATYARYVGGIQETQVGAASAAGNPAYYQYYYEGPEINTGAGPYLTPAQTLESVFRWYGITAPVQFPKNKTADYVSVPGVNVQFNGTLKSPYVDELTLGLAGSLGTRGNYRVDGVYRSWADFYGQRRNMETGQVTDSLGRTFDLTLVQNENDPLERTYYGLQVSANYRIFDSLNLGGNWTWSHLYGNVTGETSGSGPVRTGTAFHDLGRRAPGRRGSRRLRQGRDHGHELGLDQVVERSAAWRARRGFPPVGRSPTGCAGRRAGRRPATPPASGSRSASPARGWPKPPRPC